MLKRYGGQKVEKGYYLNKKLWKPVLIQEDGNTLPGSSDTVYFRMSVLEIIILSLILGAIYAIFIPLIGFIIVTVTVAIAIATFIAQKILCKIIEKLCELDHWICDVTSIFCKKCGRECDDYATMTVKALIFAIVSAIVFLLGMWVGKNF